MGASINLKETIEYTVVADSNVGLLQDQVNTNLRTGWSCVGGICAVSIMSGYMYHQAMIRLAREPMV